MSAHLETSGEQIEYETLESSDFWKRINCGFEGLDKVQLSWKEKVLFIYRYSLSLFFHYCLYLTVLLVYFVICLFINFFVFTLFEHLVYSIQ